MIAFFRSRFNSEKIHSNSPSDHGPTLSLHNVEGSKKRPGSMKKITVKLNTSLKISIEILQDKAAELTCGWLLAEAKKKLQESHHGAKYREEIAQVTGLQTVDGYLPLDYVLTQSEYKLEAFPEKVTLRAIISSTPETNSGTGRVSLRNFDLCGCLGRGAFGKVYLARKKQDGQFFAIKQIKKGALNEKDVDRLIAERDILQLGAENGSIRLYNTFQTDEFCYFVLQYCAGGDMSKLTRELGSLSEKEAKYYIKRVIQKVKGLHSKGILYRDLKAENLLLDLEGHVYLADFGLSKQIDDPKLNQTLCGTPELYAPELLRKEGYSFAVDHYNIGTLAYELVCNSTPFKMRRDLRTLYSDILNNEVTIPSHLSENLQDFLRRLLEKDPKKRLGAGGIQEIANHPWLADAPKSPPIQLPYPSIQDSVKKLDAEADKGILIDAKSWFPKDSRRSAHRLVGFTICSFHPTPKIEHGSDSESPQMRRDLKGEEEQQFYSKQIIKPLAVITENLTTLAGDTNIQQIQSLTKEIEQTLPSCNLGSTDIDSEDVENLGLERYHFDPHSNITSKLH